jgi:uncharacterized membrane protein HdeD (DUF308 family)
MEPIKTVKEVHQEVKKVNRDILGVAGGERLVNWDKYFGMGLYGAFLSIAAGILILGFPNLVSYIVGLFLVCKGGLEAVRYTKRKLASAIAPPS